MLGTSVANSLQSKHNCRYCRATDFSGGGQTTLFHCNRVYFFWSSNESIELAFSANSDDFGMMRKQKDKLRYSLSLSLCLLHIHSHKLQSKLSLPGKKYRLGCDERSYANNNNNMPNGARRRASPRALID